MTRSEIMALFNRRAEAWNRHDAVALTADYAEDAVAESPMQGPLVGPSRIHQVYEDWLTAFPDMSFVGDDMLVDGNRVVQFFTITGTHTGPFGGIPPTGRKFQISGALLITLDARGRILRDRRVYDVTNMLVQIGALRAKPTQQPDVNSVQRH